MEPEDFKKTMQMVASHPDPIYRHQAADALMVKMLKELGYEEGAAAFESIQKDYNP